MAHTRLREWRLISALAARGDARTILQQARAAAGILSRRDIPQEQMRLPSLPMTFIPRPPEPSPLKAAKPDCRTCPHRHKKPQPHDTRSVRRDDERRGMRQGKAFGGPRERVLEAVLAVADCDDADAAAWRASWERLRQACEAWLRKETE